MIFADASIFIGHFHPLLVHLPIGFLLLSGALALIGRHEKYRSIQPAISFALLAGTVCAILACITGFMLSSNGDYDQDTLSVHMFGGFITTAVSLFAYLLSSGIITIKFLQTGRALLITILIMVVTISVTGHFGGTLTHGAGYLSADLLFSTQKEKKQITDINEALIYEDIIQPMLEKKCSNCHNSSKKKGGLSMESFKSLMKGGKHGVVIEAGESGKSELIKRVSLDLKDEQFMPADNKPPLNDNEKNILVWWIDKTGTAIGKKVKDAAPGSTVKKDLVAYLGLQHNDVEEGDSDSSNYLNHLNLPQVAGRVLTDLKESGFVIKYINLKPLLLDVTLPADKNAVTDSVNNRLNKLLVVKDNIVWLNVAGNNISDGSLSIVKMFDNLQRLKLDNNPVTDAGVRQLTMLVHLESLNLYNTKVTGQGVRALSSLAALKHIYVWGTGVIGDSSLKVITGVH